MTGLGLYDQHPPGCVYCEAGEAGPHQYESVEHHDARMAACDEITAELEGGVAS